MRLIWYNPDSNKYEFGSKENFEVLSIRSSNEDRFEILHEIEEEIGFALATKIVNKLNLARVMVSG